LLLVIFHDKVVSSSPTSTDSCQQLLIQHFHIYP
jgi:hypothetical protein